MVFTNKSYKEEYASLKEVEDKKQEEIEKKRQEKLPKLTDEGKNNLEKNPLTSYS